MDLDKEEFEATKNIGKTIDNLSEEEILDDINFCLEGEYITGEHYEAIQGLLDLYNKEKKKNEELNILKGFEMLDIFNMGKESSRQRIQHDWVEKNKIREQIKQIKSEEANIYFKEHVVYFLQELLEE